MRADQLDSLLTSPHTADLRRALAYLADPSSGPGYPRARVLSLLDDSQPDMVRSLAAEVILRRGQHPLEERRLVALLETAGASLWRDVVRAIGEHCFESAALDALSWCWEARSPTPFRLPVLLACGRFGGRSVERFLARHRVLLSEDPKLVSAALHVVGRTRPPGADQIFARALRHPDPRNRATALEWACQGWDGPKRARKLAACLTSPHHRIRSTAAVLAFDGDQGASLATLKEMADSSHPLTRAAAAWGLGQVANQRPRDVGPLLSELGEDADPQVSSMARQGLADLWRQTSA